MGSVRRFSACLVISAAVLWPVAASAHELILKPTLINATAGSNLDFAVLSSHVFIASQEMEAPEDIRAGIAFDGQRTSVAVRPDEGTLSYVGRATAPSSRPFFLTATRMPQIWATTANGTKQATKRTPGASDAFKIDKFAKTLINAAPDASGHDAVLGDPLEIVLVTNPANVKAGDGVTVKVLAGGNPIATAVSATYDGYSTMQDTYAVTTQSGTDGTAIVKITQAGLWMVRVQNAVAEVTDDYDRHVTRAVTVFAVK